MAFVLEFIRMYAIGVLYLAPVLLFLAAAIAGIGLWIGRRERWGRSDAVYYAFITATTVGYGDFRPGTPRSKMLAVVIALLGLVFTGILVSVGLRAVNEAFARTQAERTIVRKFDPPGGTLP